MFGMAGGSAGQFVVGPLIGRGVAWNVFLDRHGSRRLGDWRNFVLPPCRKTNHPNRADSGLKSTRERLQNCVQESAVDFVRTDRRVAVHSDNDLRHDLGSPLSPGGHGLDYGSAVMRSATVPFGWIIGCPLLGFISDRIGRRKPVIIGGALVLFACLAWILYGKADVFPPYSCGPRGRYRIRRSDAALHCDQGSQPAAVRWHGHGCDQLSELHLQRPTRSGVRLDAANRVSAERAIEAGALPDRPLYSLLYGVALRDRADHVVERDGPGSTHHSPAASKEDKL